MTSHWLEEVRSWLGTPFHYGQSCKGVGADCVGLVVGAMVEAGLGDYRSLHASPPRLLPEGYLESRMHVAGWMDATERKVGCLLLFRVGSFDHLAIYAGETMIHTHSNLGRVVEEPISESWEKRLWGVFWHEALSSLT